MPDRSYIEQRLDQIGRRPRARPTATNAKLTPEAVKIIRACPPIVTNQELARTFKVTPNAIRKARRGETWSEKPQKGP